MAQQVITGVAKIVTHFNPFKYSILDYDFGFTGSTFPFIGDTLPITIVATAPTNPPPGNKGVMIQVVGAVVTIWVWDGSAWRSE